MYDLRIVAILTANDDGSQAAVVTPSGIAKSIELANQVYNPHEINFIFDPATDVYRINDDLLNRDCRRRDHELYTDLGADPFRKPELGADIFNDRRNELARRFPGRITVFFTAGSRYKWNSDEKRWVYAPRTFNWSNDTDEFVTMTSHDAGNLHWAHEVGHYLHVPHTFGARPRTLDAAVQLIRKFVEVDGGSKDAVAGLFDGDKITDTPPDPGPWLFKNECDPAEVSVTIPVSFADGSKRSYTFTPDRENIMSYWNKTCRGGVPRITKGQADRALEALRIGNRNHLIKPVVLYSGTWGQGDRSQTRAIAWSLGDFAKRFDEELKAGRRCVHMQAYDAEGAMRYDGVWEQSNGHQQTRAIAWSLDDFAKRFDEELKANRRCVHMQAYDAGGAMRYDGVWESGGNGNQARAIAWSLGDFAKRFDEELKANRRCVHMQAYDAGGAMRYDGVWEQTNGHQQTRAIAWSLGDFEKRFAEELKVDRRCVHMQAYNAGGAIRYDGIWESGGNKGQSYALALTFNEFVHRCEQEASAGRRLVRLQACDTGGGQIRYNGVWETAAGAQQRALGMPLNTFADHFDELTSSGFYVEIMFACLRTYDVAQSLQSMTLESARQNVFFGSDFDNKPSSMAPLPIKPLTERELGCDLKATEGDQ